MCQIPLLNIWQLSQGTSSLIWPFNPLSQLIKIYLFSFLKLIYYNADICWGLGWPRRSQTFCKSLGKQVLQDIIEPQYSQGSQRWLMPFHQIQSILENPHKVAKSLTSNFLKKWSWNWKGLPSGYLLMTPGREHSLRQYTLKPRVP